MPTQVLSTSNSVPLSSNLSSTNSQSNKSATINVADNSGLNQIIHKTTSTSSSSSSSSSAPTVDTTAIATPTLPNSTSITSNSSGATPATHQSQTSYQTSFKGWYIQPACAITGDGLQEGLEALYEMILKKRKLNKAHKKKR